MNKKNVNFIVDAIHSLTEGMKELTEKVEELKNSIDDGVFKPEYGEEYWYISGYGMLFVDNWGGNIIECDKYAIGNCFPTEQSAKDVVRVLKLIQKAKESQGGFVPDWEDSKQQNCFLYFQAGGIGIAGYPSINVAPIFGFWEDKSECEQFIKDNHDELIWFFTEYKR